VSRRLWKWGVCIKDARVSTDYFIPQRKCGSLGPLAATLWRLERGSGRPSDDSYMHGFAEADERRANEHRATTTRGGWRPVCMQRHYEGQPVRSGRAGDYAAPRAWARSEQRGLGRLGGELDCVQRQGEVLNPRRRYNTS
jgi:hypothetical protein